MWTNVTDFSSLPMGSICTCRIKAGGNVGPYCNHMDINRIETVLRRHEYVSMRPFLFCFFRDHTKWNTWTFLLSCLCLTQLLLRQAGDNLDLKWNVHHSADSTLILGANLKGSWLEVLTYTLRWTYVLGVCGCACVSAFNLWAILLIGTPSPSLRQQLIWEGNACHFPRKHFPGGTFFEGL